MLPTKPPTSLPAGKPKDAILEAAGANPDQIASLLQQSLSVLQQKLYAQDTKFFQKDGEVTDERQVEAHKTQLEAAKILSDFAVKVAGLQGQQESSGAKTPTEVHINMPAMSAPPPKVVSQEKETFDVEDYSG